MAVRDPVMGTVITAGHTPPRVSKGSVSVTRGGPGMTVVKVLITQGFATASAQAPVQVQRRSTATPAS
jgi:hypothetical protein